MDKKLTKILLIEDCHLNAQLIHDAIKKNSAFSFHLDRTISLSEGLQSLAKANYDLVLLDLTLPDSSGLDTLYKVLEEAPQVPIMVLTGLNDERIAIKAVQIGAQDYMVKGEIESKLLVRSIQYAIERHRLMTALRKLSLYDELTGLYNRRGFLTLAEQQLKLALRADLKFTVIFIDLDGMKQINDNYGHLGGDLALAETARIIKATFRDSDIIARIGGDEFAILASEGKNADESDLRLRLHKNIDEYNAKGKNSFKLSVSSGQVICEPHSTSSIRELLDQADALMYKHKNSKRNSHKEADQGV